MNLYFIGRYSGYGPYKLFPFIKENFRPGELDGINKTNTLKITTSIKNADILFFRNKPEKTTDKQIQILSDRINNYKDHCTIVNPINSFYNYDSKDNAYQLWLDNNLNAPEFKAFTINQIKNNKDDVIQCIKEFVNDKGKIFLRTNNQTGSKGMYLINYSDSIDKIEKKLDKIISSVYTMIRERKDTRIIAVKFMDTIDSGGYQKLYRAHVVGNKVICFYIVSSQKSEFHCKDMVMDDMDSFLEINHNFGNQIKNEPSVHNQIVKAVHSLGCNLGAIEFFVINNSIYFLELNPIWHGHASREGFGSVEFQNYINANKKSLIEKIPNIYNWLDYSEFYKKMYMEILNF